MIASMERNYKQGFCVAGKELLMPLNTVEDFGVRLRIATDAIKVVTNYLQAQCDKEGSIDAGHHAAVLSLAESELAGLAEQVDSDIETLYQARKGGGDCDENL